MMEFTIKIKIGWFYIFALPLVAAKYFLWKDSNERWVRHSNWVTWISFVLILLMTFA